MVRKALSVPFTLCGAGGMQYDADAGTTQEMVTRLLEDAMDTNVYTSNDV